MPVLRQYRLALLRDGRDLRRGRSSDRAVSGLLLGRPGALGVQIALQNIATIVAILLVSRLSADPVRMIRASALVMAGAVAVSFFSPFGFVAIGAAAGAVQISQLLFLARTGEPQGVVVGVFNTAAYAGMAVLPVVAAVVARTSGYAAAFGLVVLVSVSVALTIERCTRCELQPGTVLST